MSEASGLATDQTDVHLEADILVLEDDPNGLVAGAWSQWLGWRITGTYRQGLARPVSMAAYSAAVA